MVVTATNEHIDAHWLPGASQRPPTITQMLFRIRRMSLQPSSRSRWRALAPRHGNHTHPGIRNPEMEILHRVLDIPPRGMAHGENPPKSPIMLRIADLAPVNKVDVMAHLDDDLAAFAPT